MKRLTPEQLEQIPLMDIPFKHKDQCWFCGEPVFKAITFVSNSNYQVELPAVKIPSCEECYGFGKSERLPYIELLHDLVKDKITQKHQKSLAIGANWTKQELEESEFTGAALEGFKRSGWMMYEITKQRVNFAGWPISIDGVETGQGHVEGDIKFDGIVYPNLSSAIRSLGKTYSLDRGYFAQVLELIGTDRMTYAIGFCRSTTMDGPRAREEHLNSLRELLEEEQQAEEDHQQARQLQQQKEDFIPIRQLSLDDVQGLTLFRTLIYPEAILWALNHGIETLAQLDRAEDHFFDAFSDESEIAIFTQFNGLQIYLEERENNPQWANNDDPNRRWFHGS